MNSGAIEFLDHRNIPTKQQRLGGPVYSQSIMLRPKPGELVVFPPMVSHWVPPNQGDDPRVVIAWNLNLENK
jgi:hypothetical protein